MLPSSPKTRVLVIVLACLLGVTGCGPELTKVTHDRTTVPPQPGSGGTGPVPEGPVNEPALSPQKLREVDGCELLKGDAVTQLGAPKNPIGTGPDICSVTITDPGGKEVRVSLRLGETMYGGLRQATGGLDGLPLTESRQDKSCFDKVLTSQDPDIGIGVQVGYSDGEPCGAGRKVLAKIIQRLKNDPPRLTPDSGSLLLLDPCEVIPEAALTRVLGKEQRSSPVNLHGCVTSATSTGGGSASLNFTFAYPPLGGASSEEVKLTPSITALQTFYDPKNEQCQVEWKHKEYTSSSSQDGESVRVDYSNYTGDGKATSACKKAVELAKAVVGKLPKA